MRHLSIAQIGTVDDGGGAAAVAGGLMRGYAGRGHRVWHVVGRKRRADPAVVVLPDDDRLLFRMTGYAAAQRGLRTLAGHFPNRGFGFVSRALRLATHPRVIASRLRGLEDFDFPASARLFDHLGARPDIVHGHNLQGGFFDLRALAAISARVPTVLTLHDMWLLTGHCAHALGCERWKTGCGECPDLNLDPAIRRDATRENWQRKKAVYAASRLHLATPSRWLREKVEASMLAPLVKSLRVIPNGIDTSIFTPADRATARRALDLPIEPFIVLLTTGSLGSMWKDDRILREAMERIAARPLPRPIEFMAVGRDSAVAIKGRARTRSIPYQHDRHVMAKYYQAADLYLHAARADTFPLAVLEAMACATPVVATATGGIPEQITDSTGVLVEPGDAEAMADRAHALLACEAKRQSLATCGVASVRERFTLESQVDAYLNWYQELLAA